MKHIISHNSLLRWSGLLGLTALFAGTISMLPAHADDYTRDIREREQIHHNIADIRRDEDHLHDLYRRRDWLASRRDWKAVHRLDDEISRLRWHIDRDREDLHRDFQRIRRDRDREWDRDRDDRERYGSNARYDGDYRIH